MDVTRKRVKVLKVKEKMKLVIVDKSASVGNALARKNKNKNCFNCGKLGHFACDSTKPKVVFDHNRPINIYVSSCLLKLFFFGQKTQQQSTM